MRKTHMMDSKSFSISLLLAVSLMAGSSAYSEDYYVPSPPGQNPIPSHFVATTATVQHVPLPPQLGKVLVDVDGIGASITLLTGNPNLLIRTLNQYTSGASICVDIEAQKNHVRLKCRTRRLEAKVISSKKRRLLEIREVRGVPWSGQHDPPPYPFYPMTFVNAEEEPCPGKSPVMQAECLLFEGKLQDAIDSYRESYDTLWVGWSAFRLGDMAYRNGEGAKAAGWYLRVPQNSPFARLAKARLCEMVGDCFDKDQDRLNVFSTLGVPEPMRSEIELRHWRVMAYLGQSSEAAVALSKRIVDEMRPKTCMSTAALCRRIIMAGFDRADEEQKIQLLRGYISLPNINSGALAWPAARKAAKTATAIGAPSFAAKILAAVTQEVPNDELEDHLLDVAHLFVLGGDTARADVILEYAKEFFGDTIYASSKWAPIIKGIRDYKATTYDVPPIAKSDVDARKAILSETAVLADTFSTLAEAKSFGKERPIDLREKYPLAFESIKELEQDEEETSDAGVPEEPIEEPSWWEKWMPEF